MMATELDLELIILEEAGDDDSIDHLVCECDPNLAQCGEDMTGCTLSSEFFDERPCELCDQIRALWAGKCWRCGK